MPSYLSLVYLAIGLGLFLLYFLLHHRLKQADETCSPTLDENLCLKEYDVLREEVGRRGNLLAVHGTIFVVAALLLLGQGALQVKYEMRAGLVFGALVIYFLFLFVMVHSTRVLDEISYARLRGIEKQMGFEAIRFVKKEAEPNDWVQIRRFVWGWFSLPVVIAGFVLLLVG